MTAEIDGTKGYVCDVNQRELYLGGKSGKVTDYAACIKRCMDTENCRSISYYTHSNQCSIFSTMCRRLAEDPKVISKNLKGEALNKRQCDVSRGEKFISKTGRDGTKSIADCRNRCMNEIAGCNSFTYYNHGDCSFFRTCCEHQTIEDNAHTERWRLP